MRNFSGSFKDFLDKVTNAIIEEKDGIYSFYKTEYLQDMDILKKVSNDFSEYSKEELEEAIDGIQDSLSTINKMADDIASTFYKIEQNFVLWCATKAFYSFDGFQEENGFVFPDTESSVNAQAANVLELRNKYAENCQHILSSKLANIYMQQPLEYSNGKLYGYDVGEDSYKKFENIQKVAKSSWLETEQLLKDMYEEFGNMYSEISKIKENEYVKKFFDDDGKFSLKRVLEIGTDDEFEKYITENNEIKVPFSNVDDRFELEFDLDSKKVTKITDNDIGEDVTSLSEISKAEELYPFDEKSSNTFIQLLMLTLFFYKNAYKEMARINKNVDIYNNSIFNYDNINSLKYKFELIKLVYVDGVDGLDKGGSDYIKRNWDYVIFPKIVEAFGNRINVTEKDFGTEEYEKLSSYFLDVVLTLRERDILSEYSKLPKEKLTFDKSLFRKESGCYVVSFKNFIEDFFIDDSLITINDFVAVALKNFEYKTDRVDFSDSLNPFNYKNIINGIDENGKWTGNTSIIYSEGGVSLFSKFKIDNKDVKEISLSLGASDKYFSENFDIIKKSLEVIISKKDSDFASTNAAASLVNTVKNTVNNAVSTAKSTVSNATSTIKSAIKLV